MRLKPVEHYLQRIILRDLAAGKDISYAALKPTGITNSLFNYHLRQLSSAGLVGKNSSGYGLTPAGTRYVAQVL